MSSGKPTACSRLAATRPANALPMYVSTGKPAPKPKADAGVAPDLAASPDLAVAPDLAPPPPC